MNFMLKRVVAFLALFVAIVANAQYSRSFSPSVRTPRVLLDGQWGALPVVQLGGDDVLHFSFDEMSHVYHRYTYRVVHCNADWEQSGAMEVDYLDGFNDVVIDEWENSVNTNQLYTHYEFTVPNDELSLKLSGNYRVEVFDDESEGELPVASFDFSVVEPLASIDASVSGDTDISFNDGHQQLSFSVGYPSFVASPASELKAVVYQNGRMDNVVDNIMPTYITGNKVEYVHNDKLIFDAGNEYRRFEITDPNSPGMNVEDVVYHDSAYHALLYIDKPRVSYSNGMDENGRFYINTLEGYGMPIEADYVNVHFAIEMPYRAGGNYYLTGDFCGEMFSKENVMLYDAEAGYYFSSHLLKLGVYNYMYVWLPEGAEKGALSLTENNFYNTENEYLIYIYHREFGARYDKLVGYLVAGSD